jgi:two-component system phosphate regulon response regulator PhoB
MMKKILMIEDHADIRRLIRLTLETLDYEVAEAIDGSSGAVLAQSFQPDLVLLDVMMPGAIDGLQVCRLLKARAPSTRVLMLSARGRSEDMEAGMQAGADGYLVKPFSPLLLIENIRQQLEELA